MRGYDVMARLKDLKRMCKAYDACIYCPMSKAGCSPNNFYDNADEIVDKWVSEHPVKTYAMDFFEKFPNAAKGSNRTPEVCWALVYGDGKHCPDRKDCEECWKREIQEQ